MWLSSSTSKRSPETLLRRNSFQSSRVRPTSPGTTLTEALRKNPFRSSTNNISSTSVLETDRAYVSSLNKDLLTLASVFPDVQIEVLRELLGRFDGDSRLAVCTEQLCRYKKEWARGRLQVPPRDIDDVPPLAEQFRKKDYKDATFKALALEFRSSGKSVISAILGENNFSYTNARPVLRDLSSKSRWNMITSVFGYKKKIPGEGPPVVLFEQGKVDPQKPQLTPTGCQELDQELHSLFIEPVERGNISDQLAVDLSLAQTINQAEAEAVKAIFECQVCYNDITFEEISTCSFDAHVVCLECVRRTISEAIFGQGWSKSIDTRLATLKCLASTKDADCDGHVLPQLVKQAVLNHKSGREVWTKFEDRLADDSIHKSNLSIIRCPFCSYVEADHVYDATSTRKLKWHIRKPIAVHFLTFALVLEILLPLFILIIFPLLLLFPTYIKNLFYTSLIHINLHHRSTRFQCRNPSCSRKSCLNCSKPWHDPHHCHESLILSLRTTIEAARTAAIKRVCPRCGTAFVKASGCNKLTCVCGYAMCYVCRQNIGKVGTNEPGTEGYRHFCEHFRPNPGQRCTECDKCDLYKMEDEDAVVKKAGEDAEKLWREREGMVGKRGLEEATKSIAGSRKENIWNRIVNADWTVQEVVDRVVEMVIVVDEPG